MDWKNFPIWRKPLCFSKLDQITEGGHTNLASAEILPGVHYQGFRRENHITAATGIVSPHQHPEEEYLFQLAGNGYVDTCEEFDKLPHFKPNEEHGGEGKGFWLSFKADNIKREGNIYTFNEMDVLVGKSLLDRKIPDFSPKYTIFIDQIGAEANMSQKSRRDPHLYIAVRNAR